MATHKPYVRRLALKYWSLNASEGIASVTVYGRQVWWGVLFTWQWWLAQSMRIPQKIGMARMSNGLFPCLALPWSPLVDMSLGNGEGCSNKRCEDKASLQRQGTVVVGVFRPQHPRSDGKHGPCHARPQAAT